MKLYKKILIKLFCIIFGIFLFLIILLFACFLLMDHNRANYLYAKNNEIRNLVELRLKIKKKLFKKEYFKLNNFYVNDEHIAPDSMRAIPYVAGDGAITNSFGGTVTIATTKLGKNKNNGIQIKYENTPKMFCNDLLNDEFKIYDKIIVNDTVIRYFSFNDDLLLSKKCEEDIGSGVTVIFESL